MSFLKLLDFNSIDKSFLNSPSISSAKQSLKLKKKQLTKTNEGGRGRHPRGAPALFCFLLPLLLLLLLLFLLCDPVSQVVPVQQVSDIDEVHELDELDPVHQVDHKDEHTFPHTT